MLTPIQAVGAEEYGQPLEEKIKIVVRQKAKQASALTPTR